MLSEQRYNVILRLLEKNRSVSVTELKKYLNTSESTVRRDITALHNAGKLVKVFGGAVSIDSKDVISHELTVAQKEDINKEEKIAIARYAATLLEPDDFVYLDAGTTTGCMLDFVTETSVTFVTNAVAHAQALAAKGLYVILIGGELKSSTEALVGNYAMAALEQYHFTKGFFGTNGATINEGFTTPDANEALVKRTALNQCRKRYVLCDYSKFGKIHSVTFSNFYSATILTDQLLDGYQNCQNIIAIKK